MPEVPYKAFPTVEPRENIPYEPFRPNVSADTFGGLIAKGVGEAGKGISEAGDRWGQIQTDYALNGALKEADQVWEQYGKLRGQDALDQQQTTNEQLDDIHSRAVAHLTAEQVYRFDQTWRPYRDRYYAGKIASHSIQQGYEFAKDQNQSAAERANKLAADNYDNPEIIGTTGDPGTPTAPKKGTAIAQARAAVMQQLTLDGLARDPTIVAKALGNSDALVIKSAAEAMFVTHPKAALAYIEENRKVLGEHYAALAERFQAKAFDDTAHAGADRAVKQQDVAPTGTGVGAFTPSNVVQFPSGKPAERPKGWDFVTKPQGAKAAPSGPNTRVDIQIESGGIPRYGGHYAGLGQFDRDEQKRFGITDPNNQQQVDTAFKLEANENKPRLTAALGHEPSASDYYLAHQQGIGGAVNHITHPDRPAWANMHETTEGRIKGPGWARRAIWGNMTPEMKRQFPGGVDTVTSGDFVRLWAARHDQIANRLAASEE